MTNEEADARWRLVRRWYAQMRQFPVFSSVTCSLALHSKGERGGMLGVYNPGQRQVSLHQILVVYGEPADVARTLVHEMAHAANVTPAGTDPHHQAWRKTMMACGLHPDTDEILAGSPFADWWQKQPEAVGSDVKHYAPAQRPF